MCFDGLRFPCSDWGLYCAGRKDVVCLTGDGSIQMNIQELQTIAHHRFPVKIFIFNNNGYISMKQTQDAYFGGRHVACDPESGISFPDNENS